MRYAAHILVAVAIAMCLWRRTVELTIEVEYQWMVVHFISASCQSAQLLLPFHCTESSYENKVQKRDRQCIHRTHGLRKFPAVKIIINSFRIHFALQLAVLYVCSIHTPHGTTVQTSDIHMHRARFDRESRDFADHALRHSAHTRCGKPKSTASVCVGFHS